MFNYDKFSQKLREHRKKLGYTLEELSEKLNIDSKFLCTLELRKKKPSTVTLIKILNTFNMSFDDFINGNNNDKALKINKILNKIYLSNFDENNKKLLLDIIKAINEKG